jgi:hypothetical protein
LSNSQNKGQKRPFHKNKQFQNNNSNNPHWLLCQKPNHQEW